MKKLILASAIAMMCFSANAFAEDDGYGNDIPPARVEGTVDDGYGNKLPSNSNVEYKSFEQARGMSNGGIQGPAFNFGLHLAFGLGGFWDYPTNKFLVEYYGKNDWFNISFDIGGIAQYRIHNMLSLVPEVNFGFNILSKEIGRNYDWYWKDYKVEESLTVVNINIPVTLRFTPVPYAYLEAGGRINFNIGTSHTMDWYDENGNALKKRNGDNVSEDLEEWEVKTFVPSVIAGFGGSIRASGHQIDLGIRLVLDVGNIQKDDKVTLAYDDAPILVNGRPAVIENKTKIWSVQFLFNYYLF